MYLPPNSPFLNLIKYVFIKLKNYVVHGQTKNKKKLINLIYNWFITISPDDCDGYYEKMLKYISKCLTISTSIMPYGFI